MAGASGTVGALEGLGGFASAALLLGPLRAVWRRISQRRREHRLDHEGRPARRDPSTGDIIEPARQGIAAALAEIGDKVDTMHVRQSEIGAAVAAIKEQVAASPDNSEAIGEIRDMLRSQALENDKRHAENRAANAETRAEVADLRVTVREAREQAKDAAGHASRIDQQQQQLREQIETEFAQHKQIEQAYRTALIDMNVPVDLPSERT